MANFVVNHFEGCEDVKVIMDNATIIAQGTSSIKINEVENCSGTFISMNDMQVLSRGPATRLTVNEVSKSHETTIEQNRMKIAGRFSDVKLNQVSGSSATAISQNDGVVRAENDEAQAGMLALNDISASQDTRIDQERLDVSGRFSDVKINHLARAPRTKINQKSLQMDIEE